MLKVMRDILQSRYMRSNVAHKQLARTSLNQLPTSNFIETPGTGYKTQTEYKMQTEGCGLGTKCELSAKHCEKAQSNKMTTG